MLVYKANNVFSDVEKTLWEHYENDVNYKNVMFILGYNVLNSLNSLRERYPGYTIIIYQLEQLGNGSPWVNKRCFDVLTSANGIWDYDEGNILWMKKNYGISAIWKPLLYTESLKVIPGCIKNECDIDVLFYGYLSERRAKLLMHLNHMAKMKLKIVNLHGVWGAELDGYIRRSKIILNVHVNDDAKQEQVRIYYPVINGRCVLSEKSPKNHFGNSIIETSYENVVESIRQIIDTQEWFEVAKRASATYKEISERYVKRIG